MMDRLSNPAKLVANELADELKDIMRPLFEKHMDDIITGAFSAGMMEDWANDDIKLLTWREATTKTAFEKTPAGDMTIAEQEYYENGIVLVAMVKAGVELAFETMTASGIIEESAYYDNIETMRVGEASAVLHQRHDLLDNLRMLLVGCQVKH